MLLRNALPIALMFLVTGGCGSGSEPGEAPGTTPETADAPAAASAEVSAAYLAGPWCYAYYEVAGEREEEGITYVFNEDGSLRYQNNASTEVDREGSFVITAGELEIRPTHSALPRRVMSASADRFVLGNQTTHLVFERGACE